MIRTYILEGHAAVPCDDWQLLERFDTLGADRIVARTTVEQAVVSTVFLAMDHQFGSGPPLLFETMVFGGPMDQEQRRYSTWEEAEAGHAEMVKKVEGRGSEASPYKRQ